MNHAEGIQAVKPKNESAIYDGDPLAEVNLTTQVSRGAKRNLKILAIDQDRPMKEIVAEALNNYFKKLMEPKPISAPALQQPGLSDTI